MRTIHVEFSNERLITPSGLVFVGQIPGKSDSVKKMNRAPISKDYLQKQIKNGDILLTYIDMRCQGKPQYEAVREMMDDLDYYKHALGIAYAKAGDHSPAQSCYLLRFLKNHICDCRFHDFPWITVWSDPLFNQLPRQNDRHPIMEPRKLWRGSACENRKDWVLQIPEFLDLVQAGEITNL